MLEGRIRYSILHIDSPRLLDTAVIHNDDLNRLATRRFSAVAQFKHSETMPRLDAEDVLNVSPVIFQKILDDELKGVVNAIGSKELPVAAVLALAQKRISAGEIKTRWMNGRRTLPPFISEGNIERLGPAGWCRKAVEQAFLENGRPDAAGPLAADAPVRRGTVDGFVGPHKVQEVTINERARSLRTASK